ncbi:hypothetical protein BGZ99_005993 [Dissophora globulifera]|uniref:Uncharacterized protein n=1 Tax=Dissophora globulifera TaxID=979702 RepID=A0A9P6RXK5_9FUNG|nr:hypothetical protein BGZ99_005993 [Dissophora globulifera]
MAYSASGKIDTAFTHERVCLQPNTAALTGCRGNEEAVITLDVLLREICRLSTHDFSGPWRAASYPSVLEPLYQRLSDYHVCLRSARRRPAGTQSSRLNSMSSTSEIWTLTKDPELPKDSVSTPLTEAQKTARLRERIVDLETQLVQSRRAHHTLLREHILSFTEAKASTIIASNMLSTAPVNVALTETDATAIQTILASVSNVATESSVTEAGPDTLSIQSSLLSTSQISLQDAIKSTTDHLHSKQRSDSPLGRTLGSRDRQAVDNDSDACLISLKDHPMLFTEATTRLLRAETELGLLKLVMAQNQKEVSGIEEEVFQKQAQLVHHRRIFDSLLELNHLDNETQAWEAGVMIQQLELQVQELQQDKENMARVVSSLELEVRGLQELLDKKREDHRVQQPLMADQLQNQETIVAHLRSELETQTLRVSEMEQLSVQDQEELDVTRIKLQKALDGDGAMVEHIEKEHKKKTSVLRSNLAQAQKMSKRLEKEISTLAVKIVRVESLNDELMEQGEKDRAEIKEMTRQVEVLQSQLDSVTLRSSSPSVTSTQDSATEAALREQITTLEIQVEELSESLRLKDLSLEQAHEETERLTLQLEHDLAQQTEVHAREMAAFAEEKKLQAQRERSCQNTSITLFQNMVGKLQTELSDTQEKMRDISICWGHTKDQLQKCEQSYRRRKKDLEETTKHLREVEETVLKLGDAIGMLEAEKEANLELVQALAKKDRELDDMKYRLRALEEDE